MLKKIFFILTLALPFSILHAQFPLYDRVDHPYFDSHYKKVVNTSGNEFTAAGVKTYYSLSSWPASFPFVTHFNAAGNIAWTYSPPIYYNENLYLTSLHVLGDGGHILSWLGHGCDYFEGLCVVEKIDAMGNPVWRTIIHPTLGPGQFEFKAMVELPSGNLLFGAGNTWSSTDYGFLKISPNGDSLGFYQFGSVVEIEDMEIAQNGSLFLGGGTFLKHIDTTGVVFAQVPVPNPILDVDIVNANKIAVLTATYLYLADSNLSLLDSVSLASSGGPELVIPDNGNFWVVCPDKFLSFDANLNSTGQLPILPFTDFHHHDVALGQDGFCLAGMNATSLPAGSFRVPTAHAAVQSMNKAGQFSSPQEDIGVSAIYISNAVYDQPNYDLSFDVTATIKNYGAVEVDSFYLDSPFGIGIGFICGGSFISEYLNNAGLQPGDTMSVSFSYWDGDINILDAMAYPFHLFTTCPNRRLDADTSNDALSVVVQNAVIGITNPSLGNSISVYPNPAVDFFQVELTGLSSEVELNVFDVKGSLVAKRILHSALTQIETLNWSGGLYLLQFRSGDEVAVEKIRID